MKRTKNVQVNIAIPASWKRQLENIARVRSVEEEKNITFVDLMREGIKEKWQLDDEDEDEGVAKQ